MAMHDYPRFNNVTVEDGIVTGFKDQHHANLLAFTGLHVLTPEILEKIPVNGEYSIVDRYRGVLQEGGKIKALRVDGCSWTDMGTVGDYLALHGKLLNREIPLWDEFPAIPKGPFLTAEGATNSHHHLFEDWACVGHAQVGEKNRLRRCVVWDGTRLEEGREYVDKLLVPEY
jgi:mannose-1-phosphate guanylyltransferase